MNEITCARLFCIAGVIISAVCWLISRNDGDKTIEDEIDFFEIDRKISFVKATYYYYYYYVLIVRIIKIEMLCPKRKLPEFYKVC